MFNLVSKYKPSGDQPLAIKKLVDGINNGVIWCNSGSISFKQYIISISQDSIVISLTRYSIIVGEKLGGLFWMVMAVPIVVIFKVFYDDINKYLF